VDTERQRLLTSQTSEFGVERVTQQIEIAVMSRKTIVGAMAGKNQNKGRKFSSSGQDIPHASEVLRNTWLNNGKKPSYSEIAGTMGKGWDKSRVCRYLTGRTRMNWRLLEKLCKALGVKPEEVLIQCLQLKYKSLQEVPNLVEKMLKHVKEFRGE
jgi:hypothetical protein